MGDEPGKRNVLTAAEQAELTAYVSAQGKGRMDFKSDHFARYLLLVEVQDSGDRSKLEKPVEAVPEKVRVRKDEAYFAKLYFPEAAEHAGKTRIARLKATGRKFDKPPPLEDTAAMLVWYEEMVSLGAWKKQSDLIQWLRAAAPSNVVSMPAAQAKRPQVDPGELQGPAAQLEHLEMEAQRLQMELSRAQEAGETEASLDTRRQRWVEANAAASHLRARLSKEGVLVSKDAATGAFRRILHAVPAAMVRELRKMLPTVEESDIAAAVRSAWRTAFETPLLDA